MGASKVAGAKSAHDRQLAGETEAGANLRQRLCLTRTGQPHDPEAGLLARQAGAAAHGADDEIREGDGSVKLAAGGKLKPGDAYGGFGDTGDVLPTGNKERRESIRIVALDPDGAA
jgi:hypothetical protein